MNFLRRKLTDSRWLDSVVSALTPPDAGGKVLTSIAAGSNEGEWLPPSGGSGSSRRTIRCPFAFDTPNLHVGVALYTPTVGDILHDAWVEITTAWNGTTPQGDIGVGDLSQSSWFANTDGSYLDMTLVTDSSAYTSVRSQKTAAAFTAISALSISNIRQMVYRMIANGQTNFLVEDTGSRLVPGTFTAADPIKVCVANGGPGGADPGATQGAAALYLDISTPQAP